MVPQTSEKMHFNGYLPSKNPIVTKDLAMGALVNQIKRCTLINP